MLHIPFNSTFKTFSDVDCGIITEHFLGFAGIGEAMFNVALSFILIDRREGSADYITNLFPQLVKCNGVAAGNIKNFVFLGLWGEQCFHIRLNNIFNKCKIAAGFTIAIYNWTDIIDSRINKDGNNSGVGAIRFCLGPNTLKYLRPIV